MLPLIISSLDSLHIPFGITIMNLFLVLINYSFSAYAYTFLHFNPHTYKLAVLVPTQASFNPF